MVHVLLVQRVGREHPSVYVEMGSTPSIVPEGCRRGVKLYTGGRAFELVYGGNYRSRKALAENADHLWQANDTLLMMRHTREDDAVQIHGLMV